MGMEEPSEWGAAMSKRAETLSLLAGNLSSGCGIGSRKKNSAQRAFARHASRLDKLAFFLRQIEEKVKNRDEGLGVVKGHLLEEELSNEEGLLKGYSGRSALYVLMCSPKIIVELEDCSRRLNKAVEGLCAGNDQLGHLLQNEIWEVGRALLVQPNSEEAALLDSLEEAMLDTIVVDRALCVKLAKQIADGVGLEMGSDEFRIEIEKLRGEKSAAEARGGKVHALYLEQFLLVLDRALQSLKNNDHAAAAAEAAQEQEKKVKKMLSMQSISGRDAPMLPLQSFICPIMRDVMRDPVQIASGQTYEREAIEQWFAQGNTRCPVMGEELSSTHMKSNFALKQSIAEWRERNYEARLHGVARRLGEMMMMVQQRGDGSHSQEELDQQATRVVQEIRAVCEEEPLNKYKVGSMGIIPPMVQLFHESRDKSQVSKECLAALAVLARDNVENQEIMVKEGMIELLVRSLSRQKADLREAVVLMRLLSENPNTAERISHEKGAVVFLVTLLGCEDEDLNQDVKAILENVPSSDENVVIMAEANLVRPLASRIVEGSIQSRIVMANALAGMHLPVSSKASLATEDVILSLLKMIEAPASNAANVAALGALQNLTPVPSIAEMVLALEGFKQMEKKLTSVKTGEKIRVGAAKILADLSCIAGDSWPEDEAARNELEVFIYKFLQLMGSLTPTEVQGHVLKILIGLANGAKAGDFTIEKLGEQKALLILLPLLKNSNPGWLRKHAMELYHLLSQRFSRDACSAMAERPEIMSELLKGLLADPEKTLLLGILANLEDSDAMLLQEQNLLDVVTRLLLESSQDAATIEAATGIALRFSRLGVETQKKMAEAGLIERLVQLLEPGRSMATRRRAAFALAEFSSNSRNLTRPNKNSQRQQQQSCSSGFIALCLPWLSRGSNPVNQRQCRVHHGDCTVRHSFCLVEADAVSPLVALLKDSLQTKTEQDGTAAALAALATLAGMNPRLDADTELDRENPEGWNNGCQAIDKAKGLPSIIGAVSSSSSASQRLALGIVERMFCDEDYCSQYGASAQMHVIFAAQTGDTKCKRIAGRILRKLELVHSQSYFSAAAI